MTSEDEAGWEWYYSLDEETYRLVDGGREGAIEEGRAAAARGDGKHDAFFIVEARKGVLPAPNASDVIDRWIESLDDDHTWGEDGYDDPKDKGALKSAEDDLQATLVDWIGRHRKAYPEPWTFAETRNAESFPGDDADHHLRVGADTAGSPDQ